MNFINDSHIFKESCDKLLYTLPPEEVAEAMEMYNSGDDFKTIGEWLGCSPETIRDSIATALELGFEAWPEKYMREWRKRNKVCAK